MEMSAHHTPFLALPCLTSQERYQLFITTIIFQVNQHQQFVNCEPSLVLALSTVLLRRSAYTHSLTLSVHRLLCSFIVVPSAIRFEVQSPGSTQNGIVD